MPDVSTTCWATPRPGEGRARFTGGHRKVLDYHLTNRREILGPLSATWADWLTPALTRGDPRSTPLADRCRGRRRRSRSRGRNRSRRHPEPCLRGAGHVLAPPRGQPKRTVRADHEGERLGQLRRRSPSDPVAESSCRADPAPAAAGPDRGLQPDGSDVSATPPPARIHISQPKGCPESGAGLGCHCSGGKWRMLLAAIQPPHRRPASLSGRGATARFYCQGLGRQSWNPLRSFRPETCTSRSEPMRPPAARAATSDEALNSAGSGAGGSCRGTMTATGCVGSRGEAA